MEVTRPKSLQVSVESSSDDDVKISEPLTNLSLQELLAAAPAPPSTISSPAPETKSGTEAVAPSSGPAAVVVVGPVEEDEKRMDQSREVTRGESEVKITPITIVDEVEEKATQVLAKRLDPEPFGEVGGRAVSEGENLYEIVFFNCCCVLHFDG